MNNYNLYQALIKKADRKKAEKIVRDSMPKVVKDVLDGKYRKYRKGV
jgi:hypothetical protein